MLQNPCKTLGFKKNMVYIIPPGGGGKPYPASGLQDANLLSQESKLTRVNLQLKWCPSNSTTRLKTDTFSIP